MLVAHLQLPFSLEFDSHTQHTWRGPLGHHPKCDLVFNPQSTYQVVDVRFQDDYAEGHVPGAINLPMPKWQNTRYLEEHLDKDPVLYLYCYNPTCPLAAQAALKLVEAGCKTVEVEAGWSDWLEKGQDVEKAAQFKTA